MPPQRRAPIEYDCDACGAHNVDAIRLTRHRNQCKAMRTRGRRAYEKCVQLHEKRLAAKARAKAEKLASVTAASHPMPTTQTLTSRTTSGNHSYCKDLADLGEGSSKGPFTPSHPVPEPLSRLTPPLPHTPSSLLEQHTDASACVQEDVLASARRQL
ncbi:uncharacterized protein HD556DRAFT_138253 [Suillus plorans]|uniref:Uncharacterized protein n=1 Tax=Suillus plorans TaxID=116603 RepID=A0A9P7DAT9_9AGAM|nr:uncharacterized protein HD556DRAFT_138253 [Suillus plorans]KAG1785373.1 hypothetical protein HD556DRAFT_138253 [Suillus plorans]